MFIYGRINTKCLQHYGRACQEYRQSSPVVVIGGIRRLGGLGMFFAIDLDAFYCGVEERRDPSLRGEPFCVVQKQCVASLSYPARALGVVKLSNIGDVLKQHPKMRTVNGENLAKYRQAGQEIFRFVQQLVGVPVERLGLEELRFDLTEQIAQLRRGFPADDVLSEWLADDDFMDAVGGRGAKLGDADFPDFYFQFDGHSVPPGHTTPQTLPLTAYIAGNLAAYIRDRIWFDLGYACSVGAGASKNLAKMACGVHKPRGVTLVVPGYEREFVAGMPLRKVPGMGRASRAVFDDLGLGDGRVGDLLDKVDERGFLDRLAPVLGDRAPGLYSLFQGEDRDGRVINGYVRPQQISIEESYPVYCAERDWPQETRRLARAVVDQAAIDWYDDDARVWSAVPATARVACVFANQAYVRKSRSRPFAWTADAGIDEFVDRLASTALLLLREVAATGRPRVINVALLQ